MIKIMTTITYTASQYRARETELLDKIAELLSYYDYASTRARKDNRNVSCLIHFWDDPEVLSYTYNGSTFDRAPSGPTPEEFEP